MSAILGQTPNEIKVALKGNVYVAPVGSVAPTNGSGSLDAAFQDLGYTDDTGIALVKTDTFTDLNVWQETMVAHKAPKSRVVQAKLTLVQLNSVSIPLWGGGGTVTVGSPNTEYAYYINEVLTPYERAVVFHAITDDASAYFYRFYLPRVLVNNTADLMLEKSKAMALPLSFDCLLPAGGSHPFYLYSNDPNLTS